MNTDIRISVSFRGHRKRKKLRMLIGDCATDCLVDLWIGVAQNRPSGILHGWDNADIAIESGYNGDPDVFVAALHDVGFIDLIDGVYVMHDWAEHNPYASGSEERSGKARMSKLKQAYPGLHKMLSESGVTMISLAEYQAAVSDWLAKRQRNASETLAPSPSPSPSPSPKEYKKKKNTPSAFDPFSLRPGWISEKSFRDLIEHRKKKKATNTERAIEALIRQIEIAKNEGYTIDDIIDDITNRNWTGFKAEWMKDTGKQTLGGGNRPNNVETIDIGPLPDGELSSDNSTACGVLGARYKQFCAYFLRSAISAKEGKTISTSSTEQREFIKQCFDDLHQNGFVPDFQDGEIKWRVRK